MNSLIINNAFAPISQDFGEIQAEEESASVYFQLYKKNILLVISKMGKVTMEKVIENIKIVKKMASINKIPLLCLCDSRETDDIDMKTGFHFGKETKGVVRKTITVYKKGKILNEFIHVFTSIGAALPWYNISVIMTPNAEEAVAFAKKALEFSTVNDLYENLRKSKKPEDFTRDIQIIWAMARGGLVKDWQQVADEVDGKMAEGGIRRRFWGKIFPIIKTADSAMLFGYIRDMVHNGVKLPIKFIDLVEDGVTTQNYKRELEPHEILMVERYSK